MINLKKTIIFVFIFLSLLLIYEIVFNFLKAGHEIEYDIANGDKKYKVVENYYRDFEEDYYYFQVKENDSEDSFIFSINNKFNKRKSIVKKVNEYAKNDVTCMSLTFINNSKSEGVCVKDHSLYTYFSLKDSLKIKELDDDLKNYTRRVEHETYDIFDVNIKYMDKDELLVFHLPKEIAIFGYDKTNHFTFASVDNYKNKYGILVNQYYIIPRINGDVEFESFLIYNLQDRTIDNIALQNPISSNLFYNGIHNNELYITDVSNLRQYRLDPAIKTIKLIANIEEDAYIYENGKEVRQNIYDVVGKNTKFTDINETYKDIKYDQIFVGSGYAYYVKNGVFYKIYEKYLDRPIYLFKANNPVNIRVKKNTIYYIEYNELKKFNDKGINVLIKNNELISNYENVYDVYYKN